MSDEPFPLEPDRLEHRGEFPEHSDEPRPVLSGPVARRRARRRLEEWEASHGN